MERFFNTAGPVNPNKHYTIPLEDRLDVDELLMLVRQEKYFILHAPRQTGKTSALLALMKKLNESGEYKALYINVEAAQAYRESINDAMKSIALEIGKKAKIYLNDTYPAEFAKETLGKDSYHDSLNEIFTNWATESTLPLVIFIDEIDSLIGDTLISVLRQLRAGYTNRPQNFPQSVVLCGVRDVRDYRIHSSKTKEIITGGSAYNIKAKSLRMGDFSRGELEKLLLMHTADTGQQFAPGVFDLMWDFTNGQPWLVNALAYECCFDQKANRDRSVTITPDMVIKASETLIKRRETHLDQLTDKLQEERVRKVIAPILAGDPIPEQLNNDDVEYVIDLGLIRRSQQLEIANPIYREVIPRTLIYTTQMTISHQTQWYVNDDGTLDMPKLLNAFRDFFREHSEHWIERFSYKEAGPQLLLQAFLQRIINGGGTINREYALGTLRTDLIITWPYGDETDKKVQKVIIELKILHRTLEKAISEGTEQVAAYMDKADTKEGYLIIFDKTPGKTWNDKIFYKTGKHAHKTIPIWGM